MLGCPLTRTHSPPWLRCCQARRLVVLVDELYEHGVDLHILAAVPLPALFAPFLAAAAQAGSAQQPVALTAAAAPLALSVQSTVDSSALSDTATAFGMEVLAVSCRRAVSRLTHMCGLQ